MFDFQNLFVYQKTKEFNTEILPLLRNTKLDKSLRDQLRRAAFSILLNLAEGTGRFTVADRKHFYIISRGSTYECVAIIDYLNSAHLLSEERKTYFLGKLTEISKMLYAMIQNVKGK